MALIFTVHDGYETSPWRLAWARHLPRCRTMSLPDMARPDPVIWLEAFDAALAKERTGETVVVTCGLGAIVLAGWVASGGRGLRGALLLDPVDPDAAPFSIAGAFRPVPRYPFPFRTLVAISNRLSAREQDNARDLAFDWQASVVETDGPGEEWPQGLGFLAVLLR